MGKIKEDKEWAQRYILDPLIAPEPHQLDGPGTSFFNPQRSLSLNCKPKEVPLHILQRRHSGYPTPPDSASPTRATFQIYHPKPFSPGRRHSYLPPTDWAPADVVLTRSQSLNPQPQRNISLGRSQSLTSNTQLPNFEISATQHQPIRRRPLNTQPNILKEPKFHLFKELKSAKTPKVHTVAVPTAPISALTPTSRPKPAALERRPAAPAPKTERSKLRKSSSSSHTKAGRKPPQTHHTQGTADILGEILADKTSSFINRPFLPSRSTSDSSSALAPAPAPPSIASIKTHSYPPLRRTGSFIQKPSGEMAYQPPSPSIASTAPVPPRASSSASVADPSQRSSSSRRKHRTRSNRPLADTIDSLDQIGGVYHHGGPYDATLAAVNANKKKSPLEAVKRSNIEALKATPREFIRDSLTKHVPLQGTSIIPSGSADWNGNVLYYKEGADLMREADAQGGAYKRYDFVEYHPDDLKGKGEPSFSIERALKENKSQKLRNQSYDQYPNGAYELQDQRRSRADRADAPLLRPNDRGMPPVHRRSVSQNAVAAVPWDHSRSGSRGEGSLATSPRGPGGSMSMVMGESTSYDNGRVRSNSAGQRLSDGIKRRFGSLRGRK